jgi:hypothetical protein
MSDDGLSLIDEHSVWQNDHDLRPRLRHAIQRGHKLGGEPRLLYKCSCPASTGAGFDLLRDQHPDRASRIDEKAHQLEAGNDLVRKFD